MALTNTESQAPSSTEREQALVTEVAALRRELAELRQERDDLELLLQTMTDHSDVMEEELHNQAEEALRKSAQQLRMIVEATPVPVLISRFRDGQIVYANATVGPMLGVASKAILQHRAIDFYCEPKDRQALLDLLERQGEVDRYELQLKKVDATPLWVEISLRRLLFEDEPSLLVAIHDITERKRAAQALQTAVDDLTRINRASSRFVPSAFLDFLQKRSIVDIRLGDHISKEMTVMFSDLRSFTTLSEQMTPRQNFDFVNAYLKRVSPVVREHHGFIVKYLGDGMMAIFPECPDDALQAGIDKLRQVEEYNAYRAVIGRQPVRIGIGINTGHMMVGIVGDADRMQGDAFSDNVNLTSRIEGLTRHYDISLIITAETHRRLADPQRYAIRFVDKVQVQGKTEVLHLFEVFDADPPAQRTLKQTALADYDQAMQHYYARDFAEAQARLLSVLQRNPKDKVAWHHLVQATRLLDEGVTDNWTGVTVMTMK